MRRFQLVSLAALVPLVGLSVLISRPPAGAPVDLLRDLGQAAGAVAALLACRWLARRSAGRTRWAWSLVAAAALVAALAELAEAAYLASTGSTPAFLEV